MSEEFAKDPLFQTKYSANKHCVDLERAIVWETFSELFLDTSHDEIDIQCFAETIAESKFSMREIGHILFFEVTPVCIWNCFEFPGGEWAGFKRDWFLPRMLRQQAKHPFKAKKYLNRVDFIVHSLGFTPAAEAYFLIRRIERIRKKLSQV